MPRVADPALAILAPRALAVAWALVACGAEQMLAYPPDGGGADRAHEDATTRACEEGERTCDGDRSLVCDEPGQWSVERDCAEDGLVCGAAGQCEDLCAQAEENRRNVGCEFWPAPLANLDGANELDFDRFDFRVVVANPNDREVRVRIYHGSRQIASRRIGPGRLEGVSLPWIEGQSRWTVGTTPASFVIADGAYRLVSTAPVTVFQFNPFHYERDGRLSFSNDASLLFPTHSLTGDYVGVSWAYAAGQIPGYLALVGVDPEPTVVRITPSTPVASAPGRFDGVDAGETVEVTLAQGEVMHLLPDLEADCTSCGNAEGDLTGSRIRADRPIAAFGGHVCAFVPGSAGACDHLEAALPPLEAWGERTMAVAVDTPDSGRRNILRVVAGQRAVRVAFEPPIERAEGLTLDPGQFRDFFFTEAHELAGDGPFLATTFMVGQSDPPAQERGDPSMTVLIPTAQYGQEYLFVAPDSFGDSGSFLALVRPREAEVRLDRDPVDGPWVPLGAFEHARISIRRGVHRLAASEPVSAVSYGLGTYTSYAYPSGYHLEEINVF